MKSWIATLYLPNGDTEKLTLTGESLLHAVQPYLGENAVLSCLQDNAGQWFDAYFSADSQGEVSETLMAAYIPGFLTDVPRGTVIVIAN